MQAQFKATHSLFRQRQHQVFDQAHFLSPRHQPFTTGQFGFRDAGAEQAGLLVDAVAQGKVKHDLTDGHRVQFVI